MTRIFQGLPAIGWSGLGIGALGLVALFASCASHSAGDNERHFAVPEQQDLRYRQLRLMREALPAASRLGPKDLVPDLQAQAAARANYRAALLALVSDSGDWVAPKRMLDDLEREELNGPAVWEQRRDAYFATGSAKDAYLLGRLESGERARELFTTAYLRGPELSWARHGYAWTQTRSGEQDRGAGLVGESIEKAASLGELIYFNEVRSLALVGAKVPSLGAELLGSFSESEGLLPNEKASIRALALGIKLVGAPDQSVAPADRLPSPFDYYEALELLEHDSDLWDPELEPLVAALLNLELAGRSLADSLRAILLRLEARSGPVAVELKSLLQLNLDRVNLGDPLGLRYHGGRGPTREAFRAALGVLGGDLGPWVRLWWSELPVHLQRAFQGPSPKLGEVGVFVNPGLAALLAAPVPGLLSTAVHDSSRTVSFQGELIESLVQAGWFEEAELLSIGLDLDDQSAEVRAALQRARAGREFILEIESGVSVAMAKESKMSLDEILEGMEVRARDVGLLQTGQGVLTSSPRLLFGPVGEVVHPGPFYLGDGVRPEGAAVGGRVPGLAELFGGLGRMGIFGQQLSSPDQVLRPLLAWEWIEGEHLGTPFEGTVFWCQGVDIPGRFERAGAKIAGAALHEGYWIDIEVVRAAWEAWQKVVEPYDDWIVRNPGADLFAPAPKCMDTERSHEVPLLGEAKRLALVMHRDRLGDSVDFDEHVRMVSTHEEGHLCDRTRYLPLSDNLGDAFQFLLEVGFSGDGLMRRLEYRAELTALCEVADPRLVLYNILAQTEALEATLSGAFVTPHGAAYRELLGDLLAVIDQGMDAATGGGFGLAPDRYLRWQLHNIHPEQLREAALALAKSEGLVGR